MQPDTVIACDKRKSVCARERSDEAIHRAASEELDCFAALAM